MEKSKWIIDPINDEPMKRAKQHFDHKSQERAKQRDKKELNNAKHSACRLHEHIESESVKSRESQVRAN
jgi:hypothetical protein